MSDFHVRVVKIGAIEKHPNADTLSITYVDASPGNPGYPVIIRTDEWKTGDLAVYVPVDSIVPNTEQWQFLKGHFLIKAKRLRGIFSMGLLTQLPPGKWEEGDIVQRPMGITKWEPDAENVMPDPTTKPKIKGNWLIRAIKRVYYYFKYPPQKPCKPDFDFPVYTDIESLRKYGKHLLQGEEVILTEKVHGSNLRCAYNKGKLYVGSHYQFKGRPKGKNVDDFWQGVLNHGLESKLQKAPGIAFYGELYGKVQKDFGYDAPGQLRIRFFDAMDLKTLRYLDYDDFIALCEKLDLPVVPELYRGPWSQDLLAKSNGESVLAKHIREGFVVKPVKERIEKGLGRCVLKMVGEDYLLQKGKKNV